MKYYRMQANGHSEFVAIPSEECLDAVAHYLFCNRDVDAIHDGFFYGNLEHVELEALEELSQTTYRAIKGELAIEAEFKDAPMWQGDLPEGWLEFVELTLDRQWNNDRTTNDYLYCIVDNDIFSISVLNEMLERCTGADPVLYYDAHCRWLYGTAIERLKERGVVVVWGDFAQECVDRWFKDSEIPLSAVLDCYPTVKIFNTTAERDAYKMGLRDAYNEMHDADDEARMEFIDVNILV